MATIEEVCQAYADYLNEQFAQDVIVGPVPGAEDIRVKDGQVDPYVVVNFSDIISGIGRAFIGARGDDYVQPINTVSIAHDYDTARWMQQKLNLVSLGYKPLGIAEVYKRAGGGVFITKTEDGAEAYMAPASFAITVQLMSE